MQTDKPFPALLEGKVFYSLKYCRNIDNYTKGHTILSNKTLNMNIVSGIGQNLVDGRKEDPKWLKLEMTICLLS